MANFAKLNEEEIKIEIDNQNISPENTIHLIFRNPKREDFKFAIDTKKIKTIKELRKELSHEFKLPNESLLKMFFKGRPVKDESPFSEYKFSNNDVILYMIAELTSDDDEVSVSTQNIEIPNNSNEVEISSEIGANNLDRGFNRFSQQGLSVQEIHILRILFHTAFFAQNRNGNAVDWSPEAIYIREETWLNSNDQVIPVRMYVRRSDNRDIDRTLAILNTRRSLVSEQLLNENWDEPNIRILYGFVFGVILNIYTIIFLLFCNFTKKFRFGLQMGMIFGVFMVIIYNLYYK